MKGPNSKAQKIFFNIIKDKSLQSLRNDAYRGAKKNHVEHQIDKTKKEPPRVI